MIALANYQMDKKHDPPFSTDHPLRLDDNHPCVTYPNLTELAFKQRCNLKNKAYKFIRKPEGLDALPNPFPH